MVVGQIDAEDRPTYPLKTQFDEDHNLIRSLLEKLYKSAEENEDYAVLLECFRSFEECILKHFDMEESEIKKLEWNDDVAAHIEGHKASHDSLRNALIYTSDQFDKKRSSKEIPNVIVLLPQTYFDELESWDIEMEKLLCGHNEAKCTD